MIVPELRAFIAAICLFIEAFCAFVLTLWIGAEYSDQIWNVIWIAIFASIPILINLIFDVMPERIRQRRLERAIRAAELAKAKVDVMTEEEIMAEIKRIVEEMPPPPGPPLTHHWFKSL